MNEKFFSSTRTKSHNNDQKRKRASTNLRWRAVKMKEK